MIAVHVVPAVERVPRLRAHVQGAIACNLPIEQKVICICLKARPRAATFSPRVLRTQLPLHLHVALTSTSSCTTTARLLGAANCAHCPAEGAQMQGQTSLVECRNDARVQQKTEFGNLFDSPQILRATPFVADQFHR